jgi:tRNA-specific 2-thiouridylase
MNDEVLCLVSGGLDSLLAREVASRSGARVRSVHFDTGFVHAARQEQVERLRERCGSDAVVTVDVAREFFREVLLRPRHGYGSAMNPCLDCRAFLLRRARQLAREAGIRWLVTGEVVGQRGFDQSRRALDLTAGEAGVADCVVRPLSSGLLPRDPGRPELCDPPLRLHGRSRRGQLDLARRLGLVAPPTPSGGCCRLADPSFARRLRDLLAHREPADIGPAQLGRLERGRHFRLAWNLKVVVGRDEAECRWLAQDAGGDLLARATDGRGALGLVEGTPDAAQAGFVASLIARYAGRREPIEAEIELVRGAERTVRCATPASDETLARWKI